MYDGKKKEDVWSFLTEYYTTTKEMCSVAINANNKLLQMISPSSNGNGDNQKDGHFWNQWYKDQLQQFLNMPQIGLTRNYQEKMNSAVNTFTVFQDAVSEFVILLGKPIQNTLKTLRDEATQSGEKKEPVDDPAGFYGKCVKTMEKEYQDLFNASEYIQCLGKTINAFNNFILARRYVLEDALKLLPVPTTTEMDDLYKDIYHLKKRLQKLEKHHAE